MVVVLRVTVKLVDNIGQSMLGRVYTIHLQMPMKRDCKPASTDTESIPMLKQPGNGPKAVTRMLRSSGHLVIL